MLYKIIKILFILLFPWIITCCQTDSTPWTEEENTEVNLYFRLSVDGAATPLSRGSWNDNLDSNPSNDYLESIGSSFDNKINTSSVTVQIYQIDNVFVGSIEDLMCFPINENGNEYQFVGRIPKEKLKAGTTYKFMVFSNTKVPVPTDNTLNEFPFTIDDIQLGDNNYLPMWGVSQITLTADNNGKDLKEKYNLGTIYLLRAVAKVKVQLSPEMAKLYTLTKATINYTNAKGYVLPAQWDKIYETTQLSHEDETLKSFRPLDSSDKPSNKEFQDEENGTQKIIYLPEYDNNTKEETSISVQVMEIASGESYDFTEYIKFRTYNKGIANDASTKYNIVRNYNYQFTIGKIVAENALELTCTVNPWKVHEESWDYTEQVSVSKTIQWEDNTYNALDPIKGIIVIKPGTKLKCTFTIDTPTGAKWYASFIPLKGKADAFKFYTEEHPEGVSEMTGNLGEPATLMIGPSTADIVENNHSLLKIVVRTPDNRTILVKSLMPEEAKVNEGFTIIQSK